MTKWEEERHDGLQEKFVDRDATAGVSIQDVLDSEGEGEHKRTVARIDP